MIFNKIFKGFIIILTLSFTVLGFFLYPLLSNYIVSEKEETLVNAGKRISEMSSSLALRDYKDYKDLFQLSIDTIGQNLNCDVYLSDVNGKIIIKTSYKSMNSYSDTMKIPDDILAEINNGKNLRRLGKFLDLKDSTLLIGVPVYYNNAVIGGIYLVTNVPEINKLRADIFRLYLYSVIAVLLISLVIIYAVSKNITQPINAITNASKALSNGKFETRVKVYKEDEIGELAIAFNNMADSISKLENMRRSFVSDVSHELRTPMTTITGFIEGILDGTIPEEKKDIYLKIVLDESKRLSKLVSDLLEISRLTSDEVKLELSKFDINELIRISIIGFEKRFNEKQLTVNVVFENETEEVFAEKDSIKRVVTNLLDNAIKFCNEKGVIDILVKSKGDKVNVSVRNEGMGISDEDKNRIFERFYKYDKSRSQNKNGVGLGLYIVKSILDKHKEEINIKSEYGKYAQFNFTLKKAK